MLRAISDLPVRRTERLHLGRRSVKGATYFVTFVTEGRNPWLENKRSLEAALAVLRDWHAEGDGALLAAVVMPDHVHVLMELGDKLSVGRCVSRWKNLMLRKLEYAGKWQRDFWEHRIRSHEKVEDYALYMFLNPYWAGLVSSRSTWPGWWTPNSSYFKFASALNKDGCPPNEWLGYSSMHFEGLAFGKSAENA